MSARLFKLEDIGFWANGVSLKCDTSCGPRMQAPYFLVCVHVESADVSDSKRHLYNTLNQIPSRDFERPLRCLLCTKYSVSIPKELPHFGPAECCEKTPVARYGRMSAAGPLSWQPLNTPCDL